MNVAEELQKVLNEFTAKEKQIAAMQQQIAHYNTKIAELNTALQKSNAERDEWKKKCETMGDHPDVIAAALARAEANHKANLANIERLKKAQTKKESVTITPEDVGTLEIENP